MKHLSNVFAASALVSLVGLVHAQSWLPLATTLAPSASIGCGMVFDEALGRTILFGGNSNGQAHDATWAFDGATWLQLNPPNRPSPRATAMAYDPVRRRAVLFGGWDNAQRLNDTWEWDGTNWLQAASSSPTPLPRDSHSLAFDRARGRVVLFGGRGDGGGAGDVALADTWTWDGVTWTPASASVAPPGRWEASMAFDEARQRVVLFGGASGAQTGAAMSDTWSWDGMDWTQAMPNSVPPARHGAAMAYDVARRRIVLFGGSAATGTSMFQDTWLWDGADWSPAPQSVPPRDRWSGGMAYDRLHCRAVLFGGIASPGSGTPSAWLTDTWQLSAPQTPVVGNRFFLGRDPVPGAPATLLEFDELGQLIATHDLAAQLPVGIGTNGASHVRPCEVTPWGTVLCTLGYNPQTGWCEFEGSGQVGAFYADTGGGLQDARGAQGATVLPSGMIVAAHYDWRWNGSQLRSFDASGLPQWSVTTNEALAPCAAGGDIALGHFQVAPLTRWSTSGVQLSAIGSYRHVFLLKALPGGRVLIGHQPTDQGPTNWIVRDLATGVETGIDTSAYPLPNRRADVDDSGAIWILCGATLVRFDSVSLQPTWTVALSSPFPLVEYGLAVAGEPGASLQAAVTAFGAGCAGSSGTPNLAPVVGSLPRIGQTFTCRITNVPSLIAIPFVGFSNTNSGSFVLPLDLTFLGMPGCTQYADAFQAYYLLVLGGSVNWPLAIPNLPAFAGVSLYMQAAVYDPQLPHVNSRWLTMSNALDAVLGW